jgi:hypothetical protein
VIACSEFQSDRSANGVHKDMHVRYRGELYDFPFTPHEQVWQQGHIDSEARGTPISKHTVT